MDLLNITNINYEEAIKKVIKEVHEEYNGLIKEYTCFLYSRLISEKLKKEHIISRIISTKDLGYEYDHRFVLVKGGKDYYIVDLTYRQFFDEILESFKQLDSEGYQKVDREMLNEYVISIVRGPLFDDIDSLFFK